MSLSFGFKVFRSSRICVVCCNLMVFFLLFAVGLFKKLKKSISYLCRLVFGFLVVKYCNDSIVEKIDELSFCVFFFDFGIFLEVLSTGL